MVHRCLKVDIAVLVTEIVETEGQADRVPDGRIASMASCIHPVSRAVQYAAISLYHAFY